MRTVINIVEDIQSSIDRNGSYELNDSSWKFVAASLASYETQVEQLETKKKGLETELKIRTIENNNLRKQYIEPKKLEKILKPAIELINAINNRNPHILREIIYLRGSPIGTNCIDELEEALRELQK